jgi:hypothetical protein
VAGRTTTSADNRSAEQAARPVPPLLQRGASAPCARPQDPWQAYTARPKATATGPFLDPHCRVRHDKVDKVVKAGTVTLRHNSRMHHIGVGRTLAGTRITLLVDDLHIRIFIRLTGELLRELTLDSTRDFQPRGVAPGPKKGP